MSLHIKCIPRSRFNTFGSRNLLYKSIGDIASLCINLSPKTVQFSPPIFGQFCKKLIFFFPPKYLRLPVLTKYFVKKKWFVS